MKKFFKVVMFGFLGLIVLVVGIGVLSSGGSETSKTAVVDKHKQEEKKPEDLVTKENYDKIIAGDILTGEGGMSIDEVKLIIGEPSSNIESNTTGVNGETLKTETMSWSSGLTLKGITISFTNGKVNHKSWME